MSRHFASICTWTAFRLTLAFLTPPRRRPVNDNDRPSAPSVYCR